MKDLHPFPLTGGSYRVVDGALVREDSAALAAAPAAEEPTTDHDTGDAAAAHAETPAPRRRGKQED